jgi:hypothetical protein
LSRSASRLRRIALSFAMFFADNKIKTRALWRSGMFALDKGNDRHAG